ncbi:MAG TPA: 2-oxo acid dehydrogenase subunit E2 [Thiobacillus sp.]
MKQPVKMPALSDTMETGRLLRWLKQPGDAVARGDALAEVETDKAVMELEAFGSGSLIGPLAAEDREYPVGETLAWLGDEGAGAMEEKPEAQAEGAEPGDKQTQEKPAQRPPQKTPATAPAPEETDEEKAQQAAPAAPAPVSQPAPAKPEAQARAHEGATSAVLEQAWAGRAASRQDDSANTALRQEIAAGPPYRIEPPLPLRRVVAATVSRALAAPQFRIGTQLDLTGLKNYADTRSASLTLLVARACALAVREQPAFNAAWTPEGLARRERVDVAIAMEAEHGLLTPVIRDAADRTFAQLADDWRALKDNIAHHRVAPEAYRGGTFYVSNLGMFAGIVQFDAIVPPGAAAILAVAAPGRQGTLLTLTCDHRVVFGADAARFLAALAERLGRPEEWAE